MRCDILTEFSQLQRLSTAWRVWVRRDVRAVCWEWADAYWEAYGQGLSVWSPVVYEGHEPIAVLPLVRRRGNVGFLSSPWSDYNDILCAKHCSPAVLETALRAMLRDPADCWVIYDIWLARGRSHQSCSCDILRVALKQSHGAEHWIVCSEVLRVPHSAVEGAGFQLKKRVSHRALFHWFRRTQGVRSR